MLIDINKIITEQIVIIVIPNMIFRDVITELITQSAKKYKRILCVTINTPYTRLIKTIPKEDINKFYFIDAVTKSVMPEPVSAPNCTFVSSPNALAEFNLTFRKCCKVFKPEIVLFDSLSTLILYTSEETISKFAQNLMVHVPSSGECVFLFPCLKAVGESSLINNISMFALINNISMFVNKIITVTKEGK